MKTTMTELTRDEVMDIIGGDYWTTEIVDGELVVYWVRD